MVNYVISGMAQQIVISTFSYDWRISVQILIKDGKLKYTFVDNGNCATYIPGGQYSAGYTKQAGSIYFDECFKKDGDPIKGWKKGLKSVQSQIAQTVVTFKAAVSSATVAAKSDF